MSLARALGITVAASLGLATVAAAVFAHDKDTSTGAAAVSLPDLNPGEGWQEHTAPANPGVAGRAWSDLADGCHLALFRLPITEAVGPEPLLKSLTAVLAKADLILTEGPDHFMALSGDGVTGIVDIPMTGDPARSASLLACYWNEREPARCQSVCQRTMQSRRKDTP